MTRTALLLAGLLSAAVAATLPGPAHAQTGTAAPGDECYDEFHFIPFGAPTGDSYEIRDFVSPTGCDEPEVTREIRKRLKACYANKTLSPLELSVLMQRVNDRLFALGYPTSGIRGADLGGDGIQGRFVRYCIQVGRVRDVELKAYDRRTKAPESEFVHRWLRNALLPEPEAPLSVTALELKMHGVINAGVLGAPTLELRPGTEPGRGSIEVETERPREITASAQVSNSLPKSLGATVAQSAVSVPGFIPGFDAFTATLGRGDGFAREALRYDGPLGAGDHRWLLSIGRSRSRFVEDSFRDLSIESKTVEGEAKASFNLANRYWREGSGTGAELNNVRADLVVGARNNTTRDFLLGSPFSFDEAARDGWIDVLELGGGIDARYDTRRSQSSLSLGARRGGRGLAARLHDGFGSGRYTLIEGALEMTRVLTSHDMRLRFRAKGQKALNRVVPAARFLLGGADSVRGIDAGALSGDSGFASSLDLLVPIYRADWIEVDAHAFADAGAVYPRTGTARHACTIGAGPDLHIAGMLNVGVAMTRQTCGTREIRRSGSRNLEGLLFNVGAKASW